LQNPEFQRHASADKDIRVNHYIHSDGIKISLALLLEKIKLMFTGKTPIHILFFFVIIQTLFTCSNPVKKEPMKIAVSKAGNNYIDWLKKCDSSLILINLYDNNIDSAVAILAGCSGLLVTGGEDIQPSLYGKGAELPFCKDADPRRDTLEQTLIREALRLKIPVLGICRGEQILNVTLGGSLITDIPAKFKPDSDISKPPVDVIHQCEDYLKCFHSVRIVKGSLLHQIMGCDTGFVNTNHHQAAENLAPGLKVNARSDDGVIEGIEWENPEGRSFLLGVQWHPERMDTSNAFSGKLLKAFLLNVKKYKESISNF
jgi:putative glutamine amidotransferase